MSASPLPLTSAAMSAQRGAKRGFKSFCADFDRAEPWPVIRYAVARRGRGREGVTQVRERRGLGSDRYDNFRNNCLLATRNGTNFATRDGGASMGGVLTRSGRGQDGPRGVAQGATGRSGRSPGHRTGAPRGGHRKGPADCSTGPCASRGRFGRVTRPVLPVL